MGIYLYGADGELAQRLPLIHSSSIPWDSTVYQLPEISKLEIVAGSGGNGYTLGGIRRSGVELADPISETIARVISTNLDDNTMVVDGGDWSLQ